MCRVSFAQPAERPPIPSPFSNSPTDARRTSGAGAPLVLALLVGCALSSCSPRAAGAEGRFGDSTWVAPLSPGTDSVGADGSSRASQRPWETALRAPFHVVTYPLRLVGDGFEAIMGSLGPRFLEPTPPRPAASGPRFAPSISLDGPNDLGIGPAVTWRDFPIAHANLRVDGTWSPVDHRQAYFNEQVGTGSLGFRLLAVYEQRHDRRYYGIGNDSRRGELAYFTLEDIRGEGTLLLGASPLRQLRIGAGFSSMSPGRGARGSPVLVDVFTPARAPFERESTREVWYGVAGDLARLDHPSAPSRGVEGRFDFRRAAGMRAGDPDEDEWKIEGRAFVPVFDPRRVIALRLVYAGVDPRGATTALPFYRLVASAEDFRFAGYSSERFRDRQLLHARIEYRWKILHEISAIALYDVGEVAPRANSFRLAGAHPSCGGGLRLGRTEQAAWRVEVANSSEGWHGSLSLISDF